MENKPEYRIRVKELKADLNIDAVTMDLGYVTITNGKVDTSNVEELFFAALRKNEKNWILEAESDERDEIVRDLTDEQEEKLKEEHAKNYHGTDDDMPDAYESFLENLTLDEYKSILYPSETEDV